MDWKETARNRKQAQQQKLSEAVALLGKYPEQGPDGYSERYDWKTSKHLLQNIGEDPEKERRKQACLCRYCHYTEGLAVMDILTVWTCQRCGHSHMHGDTGIPLLCRACGQEEKACVVCGNAIEEG